MSELHVLFRVGEADYVLPASDVIQMETLGETTHVPGTADYVEGLIQVRGRVVPVVDLRIRFGLPRSEPSIDRRVVVIRSGDRVVGLKVDRARDVVRIAPEAFEAPPEVVVQQSHGFVKAIAKSGDRIVMLPDVEKVIGEG